LGCHPEGICCCTCRCLFFAIILEPQAKDPRIPHASHRYPPPPSNHFRLRGV
jgi:hypothetical protein